MMGYSAIRWFGIAVVALIAIAAAQTTFEAGRAGRLGAKHVDVKFLLGLAAGLIIAGVFFYGWFRFADGPLHPCHGPTGYCGKQGQPHTLGQYQAFMAWQAILFVVICPIGLFMLSRRARGAGRK